MNEGCAPLLIDQPPISVQRVLRKAAPDGPADLDGDQNVGASDLAILLGSWG